MNSILGDSDHETSWSSMHTTPSTTTWNCWIVTETSVGHIQVEYEHPLYDQSEEATRELTPSSWIAWVRPLTDIIELRHGPFYAHPSNPTIFQPAERITVIFNNGDKIKIPDGAIPVEHRGAADRIIGRLRAEVSF